MCPICMTNALVMVAGATSGAGVLGFVAVKVRALRRPGREPRAAQRRVNNDREQGANREAEQ